MRLILTNDDGHDAPGLEALKAAAGPLGPFVIVAPLTPMSACGHQVTTHRPLHARAWGDGYWSVDGWPADCVRVALRGLELPADWVLSGINAGGNLGADVYISGTVAAAREAALLGRPAIAVSHYKRRDLDFDWPRAAGWVAAVLRELTARPLPPRSFWNVNLPHLPPTAPAPPVVYCPVDPHPLPVTYHRGEDGRFVYRGDYHGRPRDAGSDVDACMGGAIAVSLVRL